MVKAGKIPLSNTRIKFITKRKKNVILIFRRKASSFLSSLAIDEIGVDNIGLEIVGEAEEGDDESTSVT